MSRSFNTAGPCRPEHNYMLPAAARLPQVLNLIELQLYFVLHAPRQSGKTTLLYELAKQLTESGRFSAAVVSMEVGAAFPDDPGTAEAAILDAWRDAAAWQLPAETPPPWPSSEPGRRIGAALGAWSLAVKRPLVVFIDEIDALQGNVLVSVLRQLRDGYPRRPEHFPWSLALVGLRDVRDYKVASGGSERLGTASPFNIKAESLTLSNFTRDEIAALYGQHTDDTGQTFSDAAIDRAHHLTGGQPWLVNALARQAVEVLVPDRATEITPAVIDAAREILVQRQDTHLDSLGERLREDRVRRVIEPILGGGTLTNIPQDDVRYVLDLGLARRENGGRLEIANPIYREVIPSVLADTAIASMPAIHPTWLTADHRVDIHRLLDAFLAFWRRHGEPLFKAAPYHEIAPHLVLMAFLHRVANAGGTLEREYAIGSGRMDICLRYGPDTFAFELKVWHDGEPDPLAEGLEQLDAYLAGLTLQTGWLVIFDRRSGQPRLAERTRAEEAVTPAGRKVTVVRG